VPYMGGVDWIIDCQRPLLGGEKLSRRPFIFLNMICFRGGQE
jgi:hypothetical protein